MLDVPKAGKLDVIMSTAICVDLVRNGQAVKSTAHTSLQGYKGYRKLVTSAFVCGCYIFQLTDPPERMVKLAAQLH